MIVLICTCTHMERRLTAFIRISTASVIQKIFNKGSKEYERQKVNASLSRNVSAILAFYTLFIPLDTIKYIVYNSNATCKDQFSACSKLSSILSTFHILPNVATGTTLENRCCHPHNTIESIINCNSEIPAQGHLTENERASSLIHF